MITELEQNLKKNQSNKPQQFHVSLSRIVIAILLTNAAGFTLRYFDLDTYFIFLGFRFHLSAVLPFLLLFNAKSLYYLKQALGNPFFKKKFLPAIWLIISLILFVLGLFLLKVIKPSNPDYFYEFGLSSIFDYPLYLIWNFPQLCLLFITLVFISQLSKLHYLNALVGCILLFSYELIPLNSKFDAFTIIPFFIISVIGTFFVTKLQNLYWFGLIVFSTVWSIVLLFGSKSAVIINIFFAREYTSWAGFFIVKKEFNEYIISSFFIVLLIIVIFYTIFKKDVGDIDDRLF